jgi:hypothetical protein
MNDFGGHMGQVEVYYTIGDMYAVTFQSWRRLILKIVILFGILIAVLIAISMFLDGASLNESVSWFPWDFYLGLVIILLLFIFCVCPLIAYLRTRRQGALGPNYFGWSDEGVRFENRKAKSLVYWSAVKRVVATKRRVFLFFGPANALVLPRRAFDDRESFDAAAREANAFWNAANR